MGNMQKVSGAFIYVLCLEKNLWVFRKDVISQVKTFSFGADSGIYIGKLMIDSGKIICIWSKAREYI